jgi:hypothetical protein
MADEKLLQDELLSDEELDKVAGGTFSEWTEISKLIGRVVERHGTVNGKPAIVYVYLDISQLKGYLKKNYNIDAELDGGYTGAGDHFEEGEANIYKINGKQISHQHVLDIIKASQK